MGVSLAAFNDFNALLVGVLNTNGVTLADQAAVLGVLQSLQSQIVFPLSLCDKYSLQYGVSNLALITIVVNSTIIGLVSDPVDVPYFNGTISFQFFFNFFFYPF